MAENPFAISRGLRVIKPALVATGLLSTIFLVASPVLEPERTMASMMFQGSIAGLIFSSIMLWVSRHQVKDGHVHVFVIGLTLLVWGFSFAGGTRSPMPSAPIVVAFPLIFAVLFWGFRGSIIVGMFTMIASSAVAYFGLLAASQVATFMTTNLILAVFSSAAAVILDRERVAAAEAVGSAHRNKELLRGLVAHIDEGLVSLDSNGKIQAFNPAAERMIFSWTGGTLSAGAVASALLHPSLMAGCSRANRTHKFEQLDFHAGPQREPTHYRARISPFADSRTGEWSLAIILLDISHEDMAKTMVQRAHDDGGKEVLNLVSHHLSTPLMPIIIKAHMLLDPKNGVQGSHRASVETIQRNAKRAVEMIETIIESTRNTQESDVAMRNVRELLSK